MKQFITLTALTISLCFLFSCSKDSQSLNGGSSLIQNGSANDGRMSPPAGAHPDIVGEWISLRLEQVTNSGYSGLHASYYFNNPLPLEYTYDRKLVFVRIPDPMAGYTYRPVPTDMMSSIGKVHWAFLLSPAKLDIGIASVITPWVMPNVNDFSDMQCRYFFITTATYLNNSIDWTDYNAVVTVLNTTP